jgi:hypothetical protein
MRYRATTQVKVLSPGILVVPVAEAFPCAAGNILVTVMRGDANLAGSKSVVRYQRVTIGTRETRCALTVEYEPPSSEEGQDGSNGVTGVG